MSQERGIVPDVRKIAVLRANSLGDFVFALPALEALRGAYPQAEIVLLGLDWHARFLAGRPGPVDRVVVPPYGDVSVWEGTPEDAAEQAVFFAAMAAARFDLAIQIHGGGLHSNPFTRRLGARPTAGLKTPNAVPLDRWVPYVYSQKETARYIEAVALVGATARTRTTDRGGGGGPGRGEPRGGRRRRTVRGAPPRRGRFRAPLAAREVRRRWRRPGRSRHPGRRHRHGIGGGARADGRGGDARRGAESVRPAHARRVSRPAVPVRRRGRQRHRAVHLATAVGAPTVGIYWGDNLLNAGPLARARHRPCISWRVECPACHANRVRQRCDDRSSLVADVEVERVVGAALDLLATSRV